jgi:hypothetical protein
MTNKNIDILKKKGSRYYLVTVVLFLALLITADFITGSILKYLYFRQSSGWDYGTKYSIEDTRSDVLIFGASRAQQQYIPDFIEDSLGLSCYNIGRDGMPLFYHYAVLQGVLKRYTPKVILLDCEYGVLKKSESSYERLSCLLPFYKTHPEMRSIIELRSPFEKYKLQSHTYPYNSLIFKVLAGNLPSGKKKNATNKGYIQLNNSLNEPIKTIDYTEKYELDSLKVSMLQSFIDDCKKRDIKLFLLCSPYYINPIGTDYSMTVIQESALTNKIDWMDYSKKELFTSNSKLFDDTVHVNFTGAKIFSAMLAGDLKQKLHSK